MKHQRTQILLILLVTSQVLSFLSTGRKQQSFESGLKDLIKKYPNLKKHLESLSDLKAKIPQCDIQLFQHVVPNHAVEQHLIETDDGYILSTFRIKPKNDLTDPNSKPTVLMMHGITADAHTFFSNGEGLALGYLLVENGFDVWVGNNRGSKYSRRHKTLDIHKKEFWQFSFMELSQHDIPSNFAYIRKVSYFKIFFEIS